MGAYADQVFEQVRRVPRGLGPTSGQRAGLNGTPPTARYVGYALRANPEPGAEADDIPCHRVVFKDGSLCKGFAFGGPEVQREMLEAEGVPFLDDGRIDLARCAWDPHAPADAGDLPCAPPPDFDWARELGEG